MLTTIVKRNGTEEEFQPSKLNKWLKWATKEFGKRVDWGMIAQRAIRNLGPKITSQELQRALIDTCVAERSWAYSRVAGMLYGPMYQKEIFGNFIPKVSDLHVKLHVMGFMKPMNYTAEDYSHVERIIEHNRDYDYTYFQLEQFRNKYSITNRVSEQSYETPQFIFMRMAMELAEDETKDRLLHVEKWYNYLSWCMLNAPTPNYNNLGTYNKGLLSCCLYTAGDTIGSLAAGDHIAYIMTAASAGIGGTLQTRSILDPVRGGVIQHQGKMPYYDMKGTAVRANRQGGRGGAATTYYSCFDPEAETITMAQNPRTPIDRQNRKIHFAFMYNTFFARKVLRNENVFMFNIYTAPDLHKLFFSDREEEFEKLYNEYEGNENFKKTYVSARNLWNIVKRQTHEVSTLYILNITEVNRHTPFKETIHSSNLCLEVTTPTKIYQSVADLYKVDHHDGEVAMCALAGIVECNVPSDEIYAEVAYYALKMIDKCIHKTDYPLPHIEYTALNRMNAGVGLTGVATTMARKNLKYSSSEGLAELDRIGERHAFFLIQASLRLGKELGNAPWIDKTKWPEGWLPIDTYRKAVDELVTPNLRYDWEGLRSEIIANKGIRNSSLINHMPTESSSKASGAPNSYLPIRNLFMNKTDHENKIEWVAVDSDLIGDQYQLAYDTTISEQHKSYAVLQKWADQAMSNDTYMDRVKNPELSTDDFIEELKVMTKFGVKGQYYQNSFTVRVKDVNKLEDSVINLETSENNEELIGSNDRADCAGGSCSL